MGPQGPPGSTGKPGVNATVDYQRLAEQVAPLISVNQQDLVEKITQAVLANMKPVEIPDAIRVNIFDKETGDVLFDQSYPLRGNGGIVDIQVPFKRSDFGDRPRSGQFQIEVQ